MAVTVFLTNVSPTSTYNTAYHIAGIQWVLINTSIGKTTTTVTNRFKQPQYTLLESATFSKISFNFGSVSFSETAENTGIFEMLEAAQWLQRGTLQHNSASSLNL